MNGQSSSSIDFGDISPLCILETSVGITCFANNAIGFQGIHKQRFSDFIVREISKDNIVSTLPSLEDNGLENLYFNKTSNSSGTSESIQPVYQGDVEKVIRTINEEILEAVNTVLNVDESIKRLVLDSLNDSWNGYLRQSVTRASDCGEVYVAFPLSHKLLRTKIHEILRAYVGPVLESDTYAVDSIQHVRLIAKHKASGRSAARNDFRRSTVQNTWPTELGDFLKFTLMKENVDTMSACSLLARSLHCNTNGICYAGTKDKRAVTFQQLTLYRKKPSDFKRLNESLSSPFIRVGNFQYCKEALKLGELIGNRFEIILRALNADKMTVTTACERMQQSGFINYFGLQRFGKGGSSSDKIGCFLLKGDWKAACDSLFTPRDGDRTEVRDAKSFYFQKEYRRALGLIQHRMISERAVLEHLSTTGKATDYFGALGKVGKYIKLLCVHAYQSYVFNRLASHRIQRFGLEVVEGDLVALNVDSLKSKLYAERNETIEPSILESMCSQLTAQLTGSEEIFEGEAEEGLGASEPLNLNATSLDSVPNSGDAALNDNPLNLAVHVVTKEDLLNHRFTIFDVLLPLLGSSVLLPKNELAEYCSGILTEDGLEISTFASCAVQFRTKGQYRKLIQAPGEFQWEVIDYADPDEELADSEITTFRRSNNKRKHDYYGEGDDANPLRALQLKFSLPPGSYATMMLREITKQSTETVFQASLTTQEAASYNNLKSSTNTNVLA